MTWPAARAKQRRKLLDGHHRRQLDRCAGRRRRRCRPGRQSRRRKWPASIVAIGRDCRLAVGGRCRRLGGMVWASRFPFPGARRRRLPARWCLSRAKRRQGLSIGRGQLGFQCFVEGVTLKAVCQQSAGGRGRRPGLTSCRSDRRRRRRLAPGRSAPSRAWGVQIDRRRTSAAECDVAASGLPAYPSARTSPVRLHTAPRRGPVWPALPRLFAGALGSRAHGGLTLDVDAPAGQLGGQACVLALPCRSPARAAAPARPPWPSWCPRQRVTRTTWAGLSALAT